MRYSPNYQSAKARQHEEGREAMRQQVREIAANIRTPRPASYRLNPVTGLMVEVR